MHHWPPLGCGVTSVQPAHADVCKLISRQPEYVGYCAAGGRIYNDIREAEAKFEEVRAVPVFDEFPQLWYLCTGFGFRVPGFRP